MKFTRESPMQTRRDAWVEVNLGAIEHNARTLRRRLAAKVKMMAILKADAYGHGAVMILPTLEGCGIDMVGVAAMDEALQIRNAGLKIPLLVIGAVPDWAIEVAEERNIALTVFADHHLDSLERSYRQTGRPVTVHIKVDTGMHRIGIPWEEASAFIQKCQALPFLTIEGIFTHLADAADPDFTRLQLTRWQSVAESLPQPLPLLHVANTTGSLLSGQREISYPNTHFDMIRPGLALFGYGDKDLIPAMGLKARIIHLQTVAPGECISYSHGYQIPKTPGPRKIATLPLGYADGIFRGLSNRMEGLLYGQRVRQVGNITMDQMMFDVTDVADVVVGDTITLLGNERGERITFSDWAQTLNESGHNTLEYELMCALRVRLPKTYTRD